MNLLEKATTITTATGYDDGKLHSVKGGSVADFDVVRGSLATRVNAEGLIEDISTLSGELVTNGDFSNGASGWSLGNWTAGNNTVTINGQSGILSQASPSLASGKQYKWTFEITEYNSGSVKLYSGSGADTATYENSVGIHTQYFVANGTGKFFYSNNFNGSITNISVIEVIDATNIPRIDYTDGTPSLLLEPQSTNLLTDSEDYSQWTPTGVSVTPNSTTSPDGLINGTLLSTNGGTSSRLLRNFGLPTSATIKVLSVYAKANLSNFIQLPLNGDAQSYVNFDVSNGVVGTSGTKSTGEIQSVGNGWYRCIAYFDSTTIFGTSSFIALTTSNSVGYGGVATSDSLSAYIWGSQYEELPYATSYIPTNGAIATRLADVITGAGDATAFNSTEGVLYAEMAALADDLSGRQISLNNGTTDDRIQMYFTTPSNRVSIFYKSQSGATAFILNHTLTDITQFNKLAFKWKQNDFALWVNGVEVATQTSGVTSIANTLTKLDFQQFNGSNKFTGKVKSVITFDTALTDAGLECLTTI